MIGICINATIGSSTYSYISTWSFPANQSSMGPRPRRLATAEASWLFAAGFSPNCSVFVTVSFPNVFTMKFLSLFNHEYDTRVLVWVCSCRNRGRRSKMSARVSAAFREPMTSLLVLYSSRTMPLSRLQPSSR